MELNKLVYQRLEQFEQEELDQDSIDQIVRTIHAKKVNYDEIYYSVFGMFNIHYVFYFDMARLDHLITQMRSVPERKYP